MAIAFIPARGGSKSIPLKNIKLFCGRPLLYWAAAACSDCRSISKIYIATDSEKIKETIDSLNLKNIYVYSRRPENAADISSTESVMLEFIDSCGLSGDETFILVQATNPFITGFDIEEALSLYSTGKYDSILSVVRTKRFLWNDDGRPLNYDFKNRPRRQEYDRLFMENGAFYINSVENIKKFNNRLGGIIGLYEMPEHTGFEIDEPDDWEIAEMIMRKHLKTNNEKKKIKVLISDVDGVLTDGGMYYSENGEELKCFNTADGMAFQLLRRRNVKTAIITSENTRLVERRAKKMNIDYLFQGIKDKASAARKICMEENVTIDEIAFIGDDINDISLLECAGISACPCNAVKNVKSVPGIRELSTKGGSGAVREFVEYLMEESLI